MKQAPSLGVGLRRSALISGRSVRNRQKLVDHSCLLGFGLCDGCLPVHVTCLISSDQSLLENGADRTG